MSSFHEPPTPSCPLSDVPGSFRALPRTSLEPDVPPSNPTYCSKPFLVGLEHVVLPPLQHRHGHRHTRRKYTPKKQNLEPGFGRGAAVQTSGPGPALRDDRPPTPSQASTSHSPRWPHPQRMLTRSPPTVYQINSPGPVLGPEAVSPSETLQVASAELDRG